MESVSRTQLFEKLKAETSSLHTLCKNLFFAEKEKEKEEEKEEKNLVWIKSLSFSNSLYSWYTTDPAFFAEKIQTQTVLQQKHHKALFWIFISIYKGVLVAPLLQFIKDNIFVWDGGIKYLQANQKWWNKTRYSSHMFYDKEKNSGYFTNRAAWEKLKARKEKNIFLPFLAVPDAIFWPLLDAMLFIGDISWEQYVIFTDVRTLFLSSFSFSENNPFSEKKGRFAFHTTDVLSEAEKTKKEALELENETFGARYESERGLELVYITQDNDKEEQIFPIKTLSQLKTICDGVLSLKEKEKKEKKEKKLVVVKKIMAWMIDFANRLGSRDNFFLDLFEMLEDNVFVLVNEKTSQLLVARTDENLRYLLVDLDRFLLANMDVVKLLAGEAVKDERGSISYFQNEENENEENENEENENKENENEENENEENENENEKKEEKKVILVPKRASVHVLTFAAIPPVSLNEMFLDMLQDMVDLLQITKAEKKAIVEAREAFLNGDLQLVFSNTDSVFTVVPTESRVYSGSAKDISSLETMLIHRRNAMGSARFDFPFLQPYRTKKSHPFYYLDDPIFYGVLIQIIGFLYLFISFIVSVVKSKKEKKLLMASSSSSSSSFSLKKK